MNSTLLYNLIRFILLLAVQVLIFNNINFLGFINPFPYLLFIILYPVNGNKNGLLLSSFLLGLLMDLFWNSGGIHTTACITLAYLRPYIFKFSFGLSYEYQTVKILDKLSPERFLFIVLSIILHHFTLFILEIFTVMSIWEIIVRTLVSTIYTTILSILIIYLIKPIK
jgi:hypothetical protein